MNNTKIRADVKTITAPTWTQIHTGISKAQGFTKAAWVMKIRNNKPWSCSCTAVFRHNRIQEWLLLPWVTLTSADHFGVLHHNLVKSKYNLFLSSSARIDMTHFSRFFTSSSSFAHLQTVFFLLIWFLSVPFRHHLTLSSLPSKSFCHWQLEFM